MVSLWVVNTSPVILLAKAGLLDLLSKLGSPVAIPTAAASEVSKGNPLDPAVTAMSHAAWLLSVDPGPPPSKVIAFGLGDGESAVLTYALATPGAGAIIDDKAARMAAMALGIPTLGTLGVVLRGKVAGHISAARPVVQLLRRHGMFLTDQLMDQALALVGE